MEFKTQQHKLNRLVDVKVEDPCKQKKKTKERKELWDSLLEVYEKEADKENFEEVSVADIEQWTISHPSDSPRAFPLVHPTIVFKALPETVADGKTTPSKSTLNLKQVAQGKKTIKNAEFNKSSNGSSSIKLKKKTGLIKKRSKPKLSADYSVIADITANLKKRQKSKSNNELKSNKKTPALVNKSTSLGKKKIRRKYTKNSDIKVPKERMPPLKNIEGLKNSNSKHTCNLTLSYYSNEDIPSTRADRRVFSCKLIFRICECFESDEVF